MNKRRYKHNIERERKRCEKKIGKKGTKIMIEGKEYNLCVSKKITKNVVIKENKFFVRYSKYPSVIRKRIGRFLRKKAKKLLKEAEEWIETYELPIHRVRLKEMRTRYGSYSYRTNSISLDYRLIMMDWEMRNMTIVHELTHIFCDGHGESFRTLFRALYPNVDKLKREREKLSERTWNDGLISFRSLFLRGG